MSRVSESLLMPAHPVSPGGQRAIDDVLVRINFRDGRPSTVQYASKGRAAYLLTRYSREAFITTTVNHCWVERVDPLGATP